MIVDLYDYDINENKQPLIFNLEIMKLAAYYSKRKDYVKMILKIPPEKEYSSLFIQKDYEDGSDKAQRIFNLSDNVNIGGKTIYDKYIPMEDDIEFIPPDTNIYLKLEKYYTMKNIFRMYLNGEHFRISCNEKDISLKWKKQIKNFNNKNFFIHDYRPFLIENIETIFDYILDRNKNAHFGFKFPIEIKDEEQLKMWGKLPCVKGHKEIHIYQLFNPNSFAENIINLDTIILHINPKEWKEKEIEQKLLEIYKYGLYFMERGVKFSLFIENANTLDFYLKNILKALDMFFKRKKSVSFIFFFNNLYLEISKREANKIIQYIKSFFPSLFFLFSKNNKAVIKQNKIFLEGFTSEDFIMEKQQIKDKVDKLIRKYQLTIAEGLSKSELNDWLQKNRKEISEYQIKCGEHGGHSFVNRQCIYCKALQQVEE